jgi:hypothetical protein
MNSMISLFLDNELNLEEKCLFVENIRNDKLFYQNSLQLLHQEMLIRSDVVEQVPRADIHIPGRWMLMIQNLFRPAVLIPMAMACIILFLIFLPPGTTTPPGPSQNRFVIYRPEAGQVEITGSFTEWKRVPLKKIGDSGYWEGTFGLTAGEHRYAYIIEGNEPVADPTVLAMEKDDFGGMNSIIHVADQA